MPHKDPVIIVVQVIASKNIELPLDSSHGMVDSSLQHGAAAYPLILKKESRSILLIGESTMAENSCTSLVVGTLIFVNCILLKCLYTLIAKVLLPEIEHRRTHISQIYFSTYIRHFLWFGCIL